MPDSTTEDTPEVPGLKDETEMSVQQEDDINKALDLDSDSGFKHDVDLDKTDII